MPHLPIMLPRQSLSTMSRPMTSFRTCQTTWMRPLIMRIEFGARRVLLRV